MRRQSATREKKRVAFNEEEILEHDKERGTRMKIEEPKTPYLGSSTCLEGSLMIHSYFLDLADEIPELSLDDRVGNSFLGSSMLI